MPRLAPLTSFSDDAPLLEIGVARADDNFDGLPSAGIHVLAALGSQGRMIAWRVRGNTVSLAEASTGVHAGADLTCAELSLRFGGGRLLPELAFFEDAEGLHLFALLQTPAGAHAANDDGADELVIHRLTFAPPPTAAGNAAGQALSSWLDVARAQPAQSRGSRRGGLPSAVQAACAVSRDALALGLADETVAVATGDWRTGSLAPLHALGESVGASIFGLGRLVSRMLSASPAKRTRAELDGLAPAASSDEAPQAGVVQIVAVEPSRRWLPADASPFECALCVLSANRALRFIAYPSGQLLLSADLSTQVSRALSTALLPGRRPTRLRMRAVGNGALRGAFGLSISVGVSASTERGATSATAPRVLLLSAPSAEPWTALPSHCALLELGGAADAIDAIALFTADGAAGADGGGAEWEAAAAAAADAPAVVAADTLAMSVVALWRGPGCARARAALASVFVARSARLDATAEGAGADEDGGCCRLEPRWQAVRADADAIDDDGAAAAIAAATSTHPLSLGAAAAAAAADERAADAADAAEIEQAMRDAAAAAAAAARAPADAAGAAARASLECARRRCLDPTRFAPSVVDAAARALGGGRPSATPTPPLAYARRSAAERAAAARVALCAAVGAAAAARSAGADPTDAGADAVVVAAHARLWAEAALACARLARADAPLALALGPLAAARWCAAPGGRGRAVVVVGGRAVGVVRAEGGAAALARLLGAASAAAAPPPPRAALRAHAADGADADDADNGAEGSSEVARRAARLRARAPPPPAGAPADAATILAACEMLLPAAASAGLSARALCARLAARGGGGGGGGADAADPRALAVEAVGALAAGGGLDGGAADAAVALLGGALADMPAAFAAALSLLTCAAGAGAGGGRRGAGAAAAPAAGSAAGFGAAEPAVALAAAVTAAARARLRTATGLCMVLTLCSAQRGRLALGARGGGVRALAAGALRECGLLVRCLAMLVAAGGAAGALRAPAAACAAADAAADRQARRAAGAPAAGPAAAAHGARRAALGSSASGRASALAAALRACPAALLAARDADGGAEAALDELLALALHDARAPAACAPHRSLAGALLAAGEAASALEAVAAVGASCAALDHVAAEAAASLADAAAAGRGFGRVLASLCAATDGGRRADGRALLEGAGIDVRALPELEPAAHAEHHAGHDGSNGADGVECTGADSRGALVFAYASHAIGRLERLGGARASEAALALARAAVADAEVARSAPARARLHACAFLHATQLGAARDAYLTLYATDDAERRAECLHLFVSVACEKGQGRPAMLAELPWAELRPELMATLRWKAANGDARLRPSYFEIRFALAARAGHMREAAQAQWEWAAALAAAPARAAASAAAPDAAVALALADARAQRDALTACLAALALVRAEERFFLDEVLSPAGEGDEAEGARAERVHVGLVDTRAVGAQLSLVRARVLLAEARAQRGAQAAAVCAALALDAAALVLALAAEASAVGDAAPAVGGSSEAQRLWEGAIQVANAFRAELRQLAGVELLWPLAAELAKACALAGGAGSASAEPRAGEVSVRWARLGAFLSAHDGAHLNFELTAQAVDTLLCAQPLQQLPPWLMHAVLGEPSQPMHAGEAAAPAPRNPPLICRVLLRHNRVADSLDLALAGLERAAAGGPRWLSAGLIDQIHAAARAAARADRSGALDERIAKLEEAVRAYL